MRRFKAIEANKPATFMLIYKYFLDPGHWIGGLPGFVIFIGKMVMFL
jgi:hypothetical protein